MEAGVLRKLAQAVQSSDERCARARAAADVIRAGTAHRWVGIYTVTDEAVVNEAWSGPGPPAFPTFARDRGLTGHALRARALALSNDVVNDPRYLTNQGDSGAELILPIVRRGEVVGTLDVESENVGEFDGPSIASLERCAAALLPLWNGADVS